MEKINIRPTRNHIIVENPIKPRPKSAIALTPELEAKQNEEWAEQQLKNAEKSTVLAAGPACVEVKQGDVVRLKGGRFMQAEGLEGGKYLLFTEGDVIAIYEKM